MVRSDAREVKRRANRLDEPERQRIDQEVDEAAGSVEHQMGRSAYRTEQEASRVERSLDRTEEAIARAEQSLDQATEDQATGPSEGGDRTR